MLLQVGNQFLPVNGTLLQAALDYFPIPEEHQGRQTIHLRAGGPGTMLSQIALVRPSAQLRVAPNQKCAFSRLDYNVQDRCMHIAQR